MYINTKTITMHSIPLRFYIMYNFTANLTVIGDRSGHEICVVSFCIQLHYIDVDTEVSDSCVCRCSFSSAELTSLQNKHQMSNVLRLKQVTYISCELTWICSFSCSASSRSCSNSVAIVSNLNSSCSQTQNG